MVDYDKEYYGQQGLWNGTPSSKIVLERVNRTISLVPKDTRTVLEVGCGNGQLLNKLHKSGFDCFGIGISEEGLKYVKCKKKLMNGSNLNFKDNSFDLVICSDVLEHLSLSVYKKTLKELERVSKKYILITTPYKQYLREGFTKCQDCGTTYHANNDLIIFDESSYKNLFNNFDLKKLIYINKEKKQNWFEKFLRYRLGNFYIESDIALCPACGCKSNYKQKYNLFSLLSALSYRIIPRRKKTRWISGIYEIQNKK